MTTDPAPNTTPVRNTRRPQRRQTRAGKSARSTPHRLRQRTPPGDKHPGTPAAPGAQHRGTTSGHDHAGRTGTKNSQATPGSIEPRTASRGAQGALRGPYRSTSSRIDSVAGSNAEGALTAAHARSLAQHTRRSFRRYRAAASGRRASIGHTCLTTCNQRTRPGIRREGNTRAPSTRLTPGRWSTGTKPTITRRQEGNVRHGGTAIRRNTLKGGGAIRSQPQHLEAAGAAGDKK